MAKKQLIEILPSMNQVQVLGSNCCDDESECCDTDITTEKEEISQLKKSLKEKLPGWTLHVYDYNVSMDRLLAENKLQIALKQRGFAAIASSNSILKVATPAVFIEGELTSYASELNENTILQSVTKKQAGQKIAARFWRLI